MRYSLLCVLICFSRFLTGQGSPWVCHQEIVFMQPMEEINTKSIEFSPVYYQQGLVYVDAREKTRLLDPKTGRAYFDLMYVDLGPDGIASKPIHFSPNIRTQFHEGPCTFSSDGNEIFFTRSNLSGNQGVNDGKGEVQLKIYSGTKNAEDWGGITALPFSSDQYSVAHPTISPDDRFLVFSSNMPGGLGGMDLYIVELVNGIWGEPRNLGPAINTKQNELFPFWHADGYLFFSSDGRGGKGKLDLYVAAEIDGPGFGDVQHLEAPFNSSRDDLGLIVAADGKSGFMASDRKPTKGKDDLYRWNSSQSIFCHVREKEEEYIQKEILVMDDMANSISGAHVWLIPMNQDGPSRFKDHFTTALVPREDQPGKFIFQWSISDSLSYETADAISGPLGTVLLSAISDKAYALVAQHPDYFAFINIVQGSELPNSIRLEKLPSVDQQCLNTLFSVFDKTGNVILQNSRVELKGNCLSKSMSARTDANGQVKMCLPAGCLLKAEISREGYAPHTFSFTPSEEGEHWKVYLQSSEKLTAPPAPIASGTVIVLDHIYYDFNKSAIRKGDAGELISLANIMKQYPDLKIEMTSHTDTRGTAEYNMELSQRRSDAAKNYLVLQGIDADRISTSAKGESEPRNHCLDNVSCSEAEHQYNRRTEVTIINPAQGMEVRYKSE